ncbi:hypothetical protein BKA93DRAFT_806666 [Sparassis latifolia]
MTTTPSRRAGTRYQPHAAELTSPSRLNAGSIQNYSPHTSSDLTRAQLKHDLVGYATYQVDGVLEKIIDSKLSRFPTTDFVDGVFSTIREKHVQDLERLVMVSKGRGEEEEMYDPLSRILRTIEGAGKRYGCPRSYNRQFVSMNDIPPNEKESALPTQKPDFILAEVPPPSSRDVDLTDELDPHDILWRQAASFIEVKPHSMDTPIPSKPDANYIKALLAQGADYARITLSARPFQLFVLGMLIFGTKFCVGMFDRRGVTLSKEYDIITDSGLRQFIRVSRRLLCDLSATALGHDSTVELLPGQTCYQEEYPSFRVTMGGSDTREWRTVGPPIWSSLSLLGRGTSTWNAFMGSQRVILKVAWRSATHISETEIYDKVRQSRLRGIAEFVTGGDVFFPGRMQAIKVSISRLRGFSEVDKDAVLHRLTLSTVGRPLWDYRSEEELILGFRAALIGHQGLVSLGILHRDVSAGNVFLPYPEDDVPPRGFEGFLADLELASLPAKADIEPYVAVPVREPEHTSTGAYLIPIPSDELPQERPTHWTFKPGVSASEAAPGPEMNGTAIFMALELLEAIKTGKTVVRDVHHDLESFVYVLFYVLYKRILAEPRPADRQRDWNALQAEYFRIFAGATVSLIIAGRNGLVRTGPRELRRWLNRTGQRRLSDFAVICSRLIIAQNPPEEDEEDEEEEQTKRLQKWENTSVRKLMTYDKLFEACDDVLK